VTRCFELDGTTVFRSTDGGSSWQNLSLRGWDGINAIDCPSRSTCFVIGTQAGNGGLFFQLGEIIGYGARVRTLGLLPFSRYTSLYGLSCSSLRYCMVTESSSDDIGPARIVTTVDGGARWVVRSLPFSPDAAPGGLSCASARHCILLGGPSLVETTSNGGSTWSAPRLSGWLSDSGPALSCRGDTCVIADGDSAFVSSNHLTTWSRHGVS
jgi:photosystem II stability/assembly factor-like uncharacterized protein